MGEQTCIEEMEELAKIIDIHLIMNELENKVSAYDIAKDIIANGFHKFVDLNKSTIL